MKFAKISILFALLNIVACSWFETKPHTLANLVEEARILCQEMDAQTCYTQAQKTLNKNSKITDIIALTMFVETCNKGEINSTKACEKAALMYMQGQGTQTAPDQAVTYFTKACLLNKQTGCFESASAYKKGEWVKADIKKARLYFDLACNFLPTENAKKGKACTQKGLILLDKAKQDEQDIHAVYHAFSLFTKACKYNDAEGCFQAGQAYRTGKGVAGSTEYAKQYYQLGCNGKFSESCLWAGHINSKSNPSVATQYYYTGCSLNNKNACFELAQRYRLGKAISKDVNLAELTYQQICSKAQPIACYWQARLLQQRIQSSSNPKKEQIDDMLTAYQKGCSEKVSLACYQLALLTQQAQLVEPAPHLVAYYLNQSCDDTIWLGCFDLARLYQTGQGVDPNLELSGKLYKTVCDSHNKRPISQELQTQAHELAHTQQWQARACWHLAEMLWQYPNEKPSKPIPNSLAKDNTSALIYFDKACKKNWPQACLQYAIAADQGIDLDKNHKLANQFYQSGCALSQLYVLDSPSNIKDTDSLIKSIARSCYNLGVNYRDGIGSIANIKKADELFKKSCQLKQAWGCYNYALALNGRDESIGYLQKACSLNLKNACQLLKENAQ